MSWKATAFVKEITQGITPTEKCLLFVLADYHNSTRKASWPSMPVLARESLVTERTAYRVLSELEGKGIVKRRSSGNGRGSLTEYEFVGLDNSVKGDIQTMVPTSPLDAERVTQRVTPEVIKGDISAPLIRKERVEPVKENGEEKTPDLPPLQLAKGFLETIGLPLSHGNQFACEGAIKTVMTSRGLGAPAAHDWLLHRAREAIARHEKVNRWWFDDGIQKYTGEANGQPRQVSKSEQRAAGNAAAIREGFGYGKHAAAGGPDKRERPATGGVKVLAPGTSG